jgi:hypothetical protein
MRHIYFFFFFCSERKSMNYEKMNSKNVANMVTRLAKRFELDEETHPETILRQKVGSLRYLIHKKYNERSIGNTLIYVLLYISACLNALIEFEKNLHVLLITIT